MTTTHQPEQVDLKDIKLAGFTLTESLNTVLKTGIIGKLREELERRSEEIPARSGSGIYLIQIYPSDGEWTPDVPYQHIIGIPVAYDSELPSGMTTYTIPAGRYLKIIHKGTESEISKTYDYMNHTYGGRPVDIEYWHDIHTLENEDAEIDIYIPLND
ncbi:GyrI-like domain-containing protein [Paenibacillus tarimensis]|uniref:GyrI-like domain-containing protein n=1 Tax=Paenibacillus tarimensis TaxID=416012 RepID=UPI001F2E4524|nr:GyrI-like domain-containing protein [Paenibacillus tarimensis]MCF2942637.1 GyrI-like domain-containing protein [Paenibacillus tarimensis]